MRLGSTMTQPTYSDSTSKQIQMIRDRSVITPFLTDAKSRGYAAFSICLGGKPPFALLGRS